MDTSLGKFGAIGLVLAAGVAWSLQNVLLANMASRGLGQIQALLLNSTVGLSLLVAASLVLYGPAAAGNIARTWEWWFVLPGLLGTFVVFALVTGYAKAGAAVPTVAVITGQVVTAVLLDATGVTKMAGSMTPLGWIGIATFIAGAAMLFASLRP